MTKAFGTAIVGGGAAGTAVLVAASKAGLLPALARDLVVVERGPHIGAGRLGRYAITSDSTADTFLTAVRDNPVAALAALIDHPAALAVAGYLGDLGVPLPIAGRFLDVVGATLHAEIERAGGTVLTRTDVEAARQRLDGAWELRLRGGNRLLAERLVLATGASQPLDRLAAIEVAGEPLGGRAGDRLIQSDDLLARGGLDELAARLAGRDGVRIAIVGGSTSAVTAANRLLRHAKAPPIVRDGLTILHRRPLRPFYPSIEAARDDGYADFTVDDICPVSGFVFRFAGLRLDARDLVRRTLGLTGAPDPRLRLHRLAAGRDEVALGILDAADVVVAALGYRPGALPLERADGSRLPLAAQAGAPLVDGEARIVAAAGSPVPNAWGIGLAAGFRPQGQLGGEASFTGQVNGLWLWQNGVGRLIVDQLLGSEQARHAA